MMRKSRETFTNMTQNLEAKNQNMGNQATRQTQPQRDVSGQELVAPKWRGPFEGYR